MSTRSRESVNRGSVILLDLGEIGPSSIASYDRREEASFQSGSRDTCQGSAGCRTGFEIKFVRDVGAGATLTNLRTIL